MTILALDLASVTGWALGEPGEEPKHGTVRFASAGASHEAVFSKAMQWTEAMIKGNGITTVVWEAPMPTSFSRGRSNVNTTSLLYGLPAVVGAVVFAHGIYDIRKADTRDVRHHFIGCSPKRHEAKRMVMQQCRAMGWQVADDNEADALATFSYMCSLIDPKLAYRPTPLFARSK